MTDDRLLLDSDRCPFCYSLWHTDIRDCPNIDPEQLIEEVHPGEPCDFDSPENMDGGWCRKCHARAVAELWRNR